MKRLASFVTAAAVISAVALLASWSGAIAQTLPPSTQDRQTIATLEYRANLPGTDPATRAEIQRQITQLEYQINTRPLIQPMPTLPPTWQQQPGMNGVLPQLDAQATVPMTATIYGSCDANRAVMSYLQQQVSMPATSAVEKQYDRERLDDIERSMKSQHCS